MPANHGECKTKSNVFNDMREIIALDLTRNELKVLMTYRLEMDEATRQVRGKGQDVLREKCGLSDQQFSIASGSLQRRGLISVQRHRNAPQTVNVNCSEVHEQPLKSGPTEIGISGNREPLIFENRNPGYPETGTIESRGDDILAAPVSTPVSAPAARESEADKLNRQAYERGLALKGGKVAKSARAVQRTTGELDGSRGIRLEDGKLTISSELAIDLMSEFSGIDPQAVCNRAAPELTRMSYPEVAAAKAALRKWAQIAVDDRRKAPGASRGEILPFTPTGVRFAKPREEARA